MSGETRTSIQSGQHTFKPRYDFIVCGSGSSGSVVARRLAENPDVSVLLLEAGGSDDVPEIVDATAWPALRHSAQNWQFKASPNRQLNGRSIPMAMGKVLGGGSSINVMVWSRGHKHDWDYFAAEADDESWNYQSALQICRRIEDWHGPQDPIRRGTGGPLFVQPTPDPQPHAIAVLDALAAAGVPIWNDQNGAMMESAGGAALTNICVRDGRRQSVFRAYIHPYLSRPNLTVLSDALVTRVAIEGKVATGLEFLHNGKQHCVSACHEVVMSLGAIHTPKLLMLSGIGDHLQLARFGIRAIQHLPGVGDNLQDHFMAPCVWEAHGPVQTRNNLAEVTAIWKSDPSLPTPDLQTFTVQRGYASPEAGAANLPPNSWSMTTAVLRQESRGRVRLTGPHPTDPVEIDANFLEVPEDFRRLKTCIEFIRDLGASSALRPFVKREVLPGTIDDTGLTAFIRNGTVSHSHQSCTAKMGRDAQSVVDHQLRVYGIDRLRIADASIMPRVTTGNTMAPCVLIGERAADLIRAEHGLSMSGSGIVNMADDRLNGM